MDSSFEKNYAREQEIRRMHDAAQAQGIREGMADAVDAYQFFRGSIMAEGDIYACIYRLYSQARDRGSRYVDIADNLDAENAGEMADAFRRHGIDRFTYSSGWSGAARVAWQFIQLGFVLEGMAEINGPHMELGSDKHEKAYGYVFSIRQPVYCGHGAVNFE